MTTTITRPQAEALAALVSLLSAEKRWDAAGILAALSAARDRAPADELSIAAIRCATSPAARTPAVIAMDGPHWLGLEVAASRAPQQPKCPTHGIALRVTDGLCTGCLGDAKGRDDNRTDTLTVDPDQLDTTLRGARTVRAAIEAARTAPITTGTTTTPITTKENR